ncbi:hypothetical protein [Pedobacter sp. GR22-6]|uniref:hypothetical protein n=1 Tax=Pedobacter sp. GR22-6 TaxID=3127957 RepID=UPI00307F84E5
MDFYLSLRLTLVLIVGSMGCCLGQSAKIIRGVIVQYGTKARIEEVTVSNQRSGQRVSSDKLGLFEIICKIGDTLMIERIGYQDLKVAIQNHADLTIPLKPSNRLKEVKISGQLASQQFRDISTAYSKEKGVFYGGKPPLKLLSPFGGSPVTFFYELFGKDARRVKRLNQLAKQAAEAEEIGKYFNDLIIRNAVPIDSNQLEPYKLMYTPKLDQLKKWSSYELANYIRSSYEEFQKK